MPSNEEIERAIQNLQDSLKWTPRQMRLIARYDQIRAECRDNPEARERAIIAMIEQGVTREDAEEWLDRRV